MLDPNCCTHRKFTNDMKLIERKPTLDSTPS
jgi:hypothetical protein